MNYYDSNGMLIQTSLSPEDTEKMRTLVSNLPTINTLNKYMQDVQVLAKHAYDLHRLSEIADNVREISKNTHIYSQLLRYYPEIKNNVVNFEHAKMLFKEHYDILVNMANEAKHEYEDSKAVIDKNIETAYELHKDFKEQFDNRVDKAKATIYTLEQKIDDKCNEALESFKVAKDVEKRLSHIEACIAVNEYQEFESDEAFDKAYHFIEQSEKAGNCEKVNRELLDKYRQEAEYDYILVEDTNE